MQNKMPHNTLTLRDSATGARKKCEYYNFSSRIERFKWIRQYKKDHPNAKISKCYTVVEKNVVLGVEVSWYL